MFDAAKASRRLEFFCPVCPDYSKVDYSLSNGISDSAEQCLAHARELSDALAGTNHKFYILLADTEDDLPSVLRRLTNGNLTDFFSRCETSVQKINTTAGNLYPTHIQAIRFQEYFGDQFRTQQYAVEINIRKRMQCSPSLRREVEQISEERAAKHALILGRPERDNELTIRYMAQYGALGILLRKHAIGFAKTIVMNYETPNNKYYNSLLGDFLGVNTNLPDSDENPIRLANSPIPVLVYNK